MDFQIGFNLPPNIFEDNFQDVSKSLIISDQDSLMKIQTYIKDEISYSNLSISGF